MDRAGRRRNGHKLFKSAMIAFLLLAVAVILYPVSSHIGAGKYVPSRAEIKQIDLGVIMYSGDFDERLPVADRWMDEVQPYIHSSHPFHDSALKNKEVYGRAFRRTASALRYADFSEPTNFIVVFDSDLLGRNANSELWSLPRPGRHQGHDVLGFADGHIGTVSPTIDPVGFKSTLSADDNAAPKKK